MAVIINLNNVNNKYHYGKRCIVESAIHINIFAITSWANLSVGSELF